MKTDYLAPLAAAAVAAIAMPVQALTAGSIAFTAFNADEDGWAVVALQDLAAHTTLFFTDNTWNGAAFATTEAAHRWDTGAAAIAAGTVVRFSRVDSLSAASVSHGSLTFASSANLGLNATNETIYAYSSDSDDWLAPTSFLAGFSSATGGFGNASIGVLTNTGLAVGTSAVEVTPSTDFGQYSGMRSGQTSFAAYAPMVNLGSNWTNLVGGDQSQQLPDLTAFGVTPVPEPGTYALVLAGLAATGMMVRRRSERQA